MMVKLRVCKRHGGIQKRGRQPQNCRCILCDMEQRRITKTLQGGISVGHEFDGGTGRVFPAKEDYNFRLQEMWTLASPFRTL